MALAARRADFTAHEVAPSPEVLDDAGALLDARAWLERLGAVGWLEAAKTRDRRLDDAVQLVGGRGNLVGHPVERLRAVRALRNYEGATDIQHLIVAAFLDGARS